MTYQALPRLLLSSAGALQEQGAGLSLVRSPEAIEATHPSASAPGENGA